MKKILPLVLILFTGCGEIISLSTINETSIRILYKDINGDYLLEKPDPGFNVNDLRIYYYDNEMNYVERVDHRLDNPYFIGQDSIFIVMGPVFGEDDGTYSKGGKSTSYIDFGNGDIDTIQVSGKISKSARVIQDVWYNGKQVQSLSSCEFMPCGFSIVK